jgi:hypothetical protein
LETRQHLASSFHRQHRKLIEANPNFDFNALAHLKFKLKETNFQVNNNLRQVNRAQANVWG